jgi:thymidylate synthase
VKIWDAWATAEQTARFGRKAGDLGPIYGHQWRNFGATERADGSFERDGGDEDDAGALLAGRLRPQWAP